MIKKIYILFIIAFIFNFQNIKAQYIYGTTGLLHMPTANMQQDKTFMLGSSFLNTAATPNHWSYNTFNYFINITFFPWLEIGYTCTLHKGVPGNYWPEITWGRFVNQDRQFSGRLRLWKEGWLKKWTPQIVLGANDPSTNDIIGNPNKNDYGISEVGKTGNGHWNRYYIAATKHISFNTIGNLGIHIAYVYNKRKDYHLNGPCFGVNFQFQLTSQQFLMKAINNLNVMAEYDSRTINVGISRPIWRDHINFIIEMTKCKYISGGIYFKIHLK